MSEERAFVPKFRMLTQDQLSSWLGIPVSTLETWRSRPGRYRLPFVKIGRDVKYREIDVLKFIEQNTYDLAADAIQDRQAG